jgi:hypothetical protein
MKTIITLINLSTIIACLTFTVQGNRASSRPRTSPSASPFHFALPIPALAVLKSGPCRPLTIPVGVMAPLALSADAINETAHSGWRG